MIPPMSLVLSVILIKPFVLSLLSRLAISGIVVNKPFLHSSAESRQRFCLRQARLDEVKPSQLSFGMCDYLSHFWRGFSGHYESRWLAK